MLSSQLERCPNIPASLRFELQPSHLLARPLDWPQPQETRASERRRPAVLFFPPDSTLVYKTQNCGRRFYQGPLEAFELPLADEMII